MSCRISKQRGSGFAFVRRKGGNIDESLHLGIVTSLGDDGATIGVADENDVAPGGINRALGDGCVVRQADRRVLNDDDVVAVALEDLVHALPSGAIHKSAVNENDALLLRGRRGDTTSRYEREGARVGKQFTKRHGSLLDTTVRIRFGTVAAARDQPRGRSCRRSVAAPRGAIVALAEEAL